MENKKLRIWWNSNFGNKPFTKEVKDVDEAKLILQTLTDYDLYLGDKIESNACGLEEFIGINNPYYIDTNDGWIEWDNEEGNNINDIMEKEK